MKTETLRKYEKLKIKIRKAKLHFTFLTNFQTLNAYRKFLTFNLPNVTSHDARFIRKRLLRSAIKQRKEDLGSLRKDAVVYEKGLGKVLSSIDTYILDNAIKENNYKYAVKTIKTNEKKLRNLTKNLTLTFTDTKTFNNLSNVTLTTEELELLTPTSSKKNGYSDYVWFYSMRDDETFETWKQSAEVKTKITNLAHSYVHSYKPTLHAVKKHRILKRLTSNKDIAILQPDKDSGRVILNRDKYINKLSDIIGDTSKFKKLSADATLLREGQLHRFLRKLKNKQIFTKEVYDKTYSSGSKPASITVYLKFII